MNKPFIKLALKILKMIKEFKEGDFICLKKEINRKNIRLPNCEYETIFGYVHQYNQRKNIVLDKVLNFADVIEGETREMLIIRQNIPFKGWKVKFINDKIKKIIFSSEKKYLTEPIL